MEKIKNVLHEAAKSKCVVYGGFLRDLVRDEKFTDVDMYCEDRGFIERLKTKSPTAFDNNGSFYYKDVKIDYRFSDKIVPDFSCNALAYDLRSGLLFTTNNESLLMVLEDIAKRKCRVIDKDVNPLRAQKMKAKGYEVIA